MLQRYPPPPRPPGTRGATSGFCVCSTVSSLGVALPTLPAAEDSGRGEAAEQSPPAGAARYGWLASGAARAGLVVASAGLAVAFAAFFQIGLGLPCMPPARRSPSDSIPISCRRSDAVRSLDKLYPPYGHIPKSVKPVIDALQLPQLLHSDVSIWDCTVSLMRLTADGEVSSALALCMLAVFTLALTVLDMLALVAASVRLWCADDPSALPACPFVSVSKVLKKLSMLDVCTMGVY
ncbi:unnamed protein product, partial [Prorocentrum cordatum]